MSIKCITEPSVQV